MWVPGGVSGTPRHEINVLSHFEPDLSSPGLTLVPTGIIKPRNLLKKLSKCERRQTNGYRMRFIVNFNQRMTLWQFGIILPLILPIPLETETTEIKMGNAFNLYRIWVSDTHTHTRTHTHIAIKSKCKVTDFTGKWPKWHIFTGISKFKAFKHTSKHSYEDISRRANTYKEITITWLFHCI